MQKIRSYSLEQMGEAMKNSVVFSILLAICLILGGCGKQQSVSNSQTDALFRAVREGNTDMVRSLLSSPGADVNATDERGSTPLLEAARYGHEDICRVLIAAGANLKSKDKDGKTALTLAVQGDHDEVVRLLKQAGETE
jgi:ankyrin repeat protein